MKKSRIPIFDINLAAFQHLHGNSPELEMQGTRVIFLFTPDNTFYKLSERYNSNEPVTVLDYVSSSRQLRSMMLSLRGKDNGKENGDKH